MHACRRNLIALAVGALLVPCLASAEPFTAIGHALVASTSAGDRDPMDRHPHPNRSTTHDADANTSPPQDPANDAGDSASDDAAGGTGSGQSSTSAAQSNPGQGNWWADIDGDNDDRISRAEASGNEGLDSRFASVDTDGDGFVTRDEYKAYYQANASQGAEHAEDHSAVATADVWKRFDADGDGSLSAVEVAADARLEDDFGSIDANHDGHVSNDEYRAYYRGD